MPSCLYCSTTDSANTKAGASTPPAELAVGDGQVMMEAVLVLNAGSSSIKFSLFTLEDDSTLALSSRGQIEGIGSAARLIARGACGEVLVDQALDPAEASDHAGCLRHLRSWLARGLEHLRLAAVGHRVVHGGADFGAPIRIDQRAIERLAALVPLAPLHQPHNLAAIQAIWEMDRHLPQIACFDTAFHRSQPIVAEVFALPFELYEQGVRRYGFHGLSYEWVASRLPEVAPKLAVGRVVVAHLGSGASLCALRSGRSVATSMGLTPLDGVPMGTRPGAIDPGALLHLLEQRRMGVGELSDLLYHQSGLLGLSGFSNDMRQLLASRTPRAALAIDHFVERTCQQVAALAASLEGLDGLVFTAGIGEGSPEIRERICARLGWLGVELDEDANQGGGPRITRPGAKVSAWIIPTDEERVIARHTTALLGAES